MVDRLTITNLKIWHLQDWVHAAAGQTSLAFESDNTLAEVRDKLQQLGDLNKERNRLMDAIDARFGDIGPPRTKL